jgi:hypothetical protein
LFCCSILICRISFAFFLYSLLPFLVSDPSVRPNRPYEVDERGWGEFDIQVTLYVRGHETHPYLFTHPLKLHSTRSKVCESWLTCEAIE